jgi:hypothetical protein
MIIDRGPMTQMMARPMIIFFVTVKRVSYSWTRMFLGASPETIFRIIVWGGRTLDSPRTGNANEQRRG